MLDLSLDSIMSVGIVHHMIRIVHLSIVELCLSHMLSAHCCFVVNHVEVILLLEVIWILVVSFIIKSDLVQYLLMVTHMFNAFVIR